MKHGGRIFMGLIVVIVLMAVGCEEVFDEDLQEERLEILAPSNNLITKKTTLTFWWNALKDADTYQLQVVRSHFDTITSIVADTTLTGSKFELTLNPGRYQWRVWAENGGSRSDTTTYNLKIEDSPDLSEQEVVLKKPKDNEVFADTHIDFLWDELPNATDYVLIVKEKDWDGDNVFNPEYTTDTEISKKLEEGKYVWGVKALNSSSTTLPRVRTFYVDLTAPEKPTLTEPESGSTVTEAPISMKWRTYQEDLTKVYDSLFIATDIDFKVVLKREKLSSSSYEFSTENEGEYFWRVKTIDEAGNASAYSDIFKFTYSK